MLNQVQNPMFAALSSLVGHRFKLNQLRQQLNDTTLPFRAEVDQEINDIYDRSDRMLSEITQKCETGKLAEIAARSLINPADGTPWLRHSTKRFHDCVTACGTLVEIKHRKDVEGTIRKFINHDSEKYNKSKYLMLFVSDKEDLWLDRVVDVEAVKNAPKTVEETKAATQHEVKLTGRSFTIYEFDYNTLGKRGIKEIVFIDGNKRWVKPVTWFFQHRRESNSGAKVGGYYVYKSDVIGKS